MIWEVTQGYGVVTPWLPVQTLTATTHQTHCLGPLGQRAYIAKPSHCPLLAGFFIQAADNQIQMPRSYRV